MNFKFISLEPEPRFFFFANIFKECFHMLKYLWKGKKIISNKKTKEENPSIEKLIGSL